jgi:hypothetical protein
MFLELSKMAKNIFFGDGTKFLLFSHCGVGGGGLIFFEGWGK